MYCRRNKSESLKENELSVLLLYAQGRTAKEIARIIEKTNDHVHQILFSCRKKLGAISTANAVYLAVTKGFL
jgi:DNA-binding NarL/FixJ family response regulator